MYLQLFSNDTQLWPIEGVGPGVLSRYFQYFKEFISQQNFHLKTKQLPQTNKYHLAFDASFSFYFS